MRTAAPGIAPGRMLVRSRDEMVLRVASACERIISYASAEAQQELELSAHLQLSCAKWK